MAEPLWRELRRSRRTSSTTPPAERTTVPPPPRPHFKLAVVSTVIAIAAIVGATNVHFVVDTLHIWPKHHRFGWHGLMAGVFLIFGTIAVRSFATALGRLVHVSAGPAAGSAIRLIGTITGVIFVIIGTLLILGISPTRVLTAAGITGVILGLAAQQSLGNVFAGIVLMFARPFVVGERIRVRSGALGGIFEGEVRSMGLTYVEVLTADEGLIKVPNLAIMAAAVGPASAPKREQPEQSLYVDAGPPRRPPHSAQPHPSTHEPAARPVRLPRDVIRRMRERRPNDDDGE